MGPRYIFEFKGKSGKIHVLDLQDRRLAAIVKRSRDLPGYELFQYLDERGAHVRSSREWSIDIYARRQGKISPRKSFRTWHGTVQAA